MEDKRTRKLAGTGGDWRATHNMKSREEAIIGGCEALLRTEWSVWIHVRYQIHKQILRNPDFRPPHASANKPKGRMKNSRLNHAHPKHALNVTAYQASGDCQATGPSEVFWYLGRERFHHLQQREKVTEP